MIKEIIVRSLKCYVPARKDREASNVSNDAWKRKCSADLSSAHNFTSWLSTVNKPNHDISNACGRYESTNPPLGADVTIKCAREAVQGQSREWTVGQVPVVALLIRSPTCGHVSARQLPCAVGPWVAHQERKGKQ
jgi:hypothetical protein